MSRIQNSSPQPLWSHPLLALFCLLMGFWLACLIRTRDTMGSWACPFHTGKLTSLSFSCHRVLVASAHIHLCSSLGRVGPRLQKTEKMNRKRQERHGAMHRVLSQAVGKGGDYISFNSRRALSFFWAHLTRYSINVRQGVGRSKHVIMEKKKGAIWLMSDVWTVKYCNAQVTLRELEPV